METENLKLRARTSEFESILQLKDKELVKLRKKLQAIESSSETLKRNHAGKLDAVVGKRARQVEEASSYQIYLLEKKSNYVFRLFET